MKQLISALLILFTSIISCNTEGDEFFKNQEADILFVGNSLTYFNDMPEMVKEIVANLGRDIKVQVYALPNLGLEDHWKEGIVRNLLRDRSYKYVVFQQGPSSQADGRSSLLKYGGEISQYARSQNVVPMYFMVWPAIQYYDTFDGVIQNYRDAAKANGAMLAPVGELWKEYRTNQFTIDLYDKDEFHPSKAGSFLAALTIVHQLYPDLDLDKLRHQGMSKYINQEYAFDQIVGLVNRD